MTNPSSPKHLFTIFPRATHAEDQTYAHTILTTHVTHRGFQAGAFIGLLTGTIRAAISARRTAASTSTTTATSALPVSPTTTSQILVRSAGRSALLTALLLGGTVPLYMGYVLRDVEGAEDREYGWRDRAYRLLHNDGQVGVDQGSVVGMGLGGVAVAVQGGLRQGVYAAAGRVGLGSLLGVVGWQVWRGVSG